MSSLNTLTLKKAVQKLQSKEISHQELYAAVETAIDDQNPKVNAYLAQNHQALNEAHDAAQLPLAGAPIAVKDNFLTVGLTTTASSLVLKDFAPPYESTPTKRLKQAGGVVIGKTNMDAWAHGSSTETSDFGTSRNPLNQEYSPGGSSGGSAVAVAADMCIASLGSETAGSIRIPASWCGIVGMKPTYGRVSRAGVVAMGSSLDSPGPLTKTVEDAAMLLRHIAGKDQYDATTANVVVPDYLANLGVGVKGLRIGIVYLDHAQIPSFVVDKVMAAAKVFEENGAKVEQVSLSNKVEHKKVLKPDYAIGVYTVVQRSEVSSNLARYDGIRYGKGREFFGDEAKRRIMLGTFTLSKGYADKYYTKAQQVRQLYVENFKQLFQEYDLLLTTPSPGYALKIGESKKSPMFGELVDMLNEPSSLAGLPAISLPCYNDPETNLSLGLCLMGNYFQEQTVLSAAYLYEQATQWNRWVNQKDRNL